MEVLTQYMPNGLINAFGGESDVLSLPKFEKSNLDMWTDYPDCIRYNEVSSPIMIGMDQYRRTFIVFKFQFVQSDKTKYITTVLFQRYTDNPFWTSACNPSGIYNVFGEGGRIDYNLVKQVLATQRINNIKNPYTDETGDYINK